MLKAGYRPDPAATLQVGSVQTLARRLDKLPSVALLIIDEAHHSAASSYLELLRRYESAYVLGLTATPARIDGQGFQFIYDALILGHSVAQLIADGHLCPYRLFAAPKAIDTSGVPVVAGEYNQRQLAEAVNTRLVMGDLIETWRKYASGKKTVVFAVNVAHSQAFTAAYLAAGVSAEHPDGEAPSDERAAILNRFRSGETLILTNCGIVSEGFDVPMEEIPLDVNPLVWHKMQELRTQQQERNLKPIWVYYTLRDSFDSLSYGDLRECARILGYKPGWAWYKVPG